MSIQPLTWDDFEDSSVAPEEPTVITGWRLLIARKGKNVQTVPRKRT